MEEEERKIKDIYSCEYIVDDGELYPLQKWYNQLLDKQLKDVDISDVLRMLRQNEFIDIAIPMAIALLKKNLFAGEMYEGEIIEKLSVVDNSNLTIYYNELKDILLNALNESKSYEWLCAEDKEEFEEIVNKFLEKIS